MEQQYSVTQYASLNNITRQAVLLQIKENRLPANVSAKKIGNSYCITVMENVALEISSEEECPICKSTPCINGDTIYVE